MKKRKKNISHHTAEGQDVKNLANAEQFPKIIE